MSKGWGIFKSRFFPIKNETIQKNQNFQNFKISKFWKLKKSKFSKKNQNFEISTQKIKIFQKKPITFFFDQLFFSKKSRKKCQKYFSENKFGNEKKVFFYLVKSFFGMWPRRCLLPIFKSRLRLVCYEVRKGLKICPISKVFPRFFAPCWKNGPLTTKSKKNNSYSTECKNNTHFSAGALRAPGRIISCKNSRRFRQIKSKNNHTRRIVTI